MAENVMAMTLRMRNTAKRTAQDFEKQIHKTARAGQSMGTKFGRSIKATKTSIGGLAGSMISLKTIIIATFAYRAVQRFSRFVGSLTKLYNDQAEATRKLNENLASFNNYSQEASDALREQANSLQTLTGIANETVEMNQAVLASYGLEAEEIRKITPLVIDFAKAKSIDLKTAFELVGKASVGYMGTLSRYGIILDSTLSVEKKWQAVLANLGQYYGTAAALANMYSGQVSVLKEEWNDAKKAMGSVIAAGTEQSSVLETLHKAVKRVKEWFEKWQPVMSEFASGVMKNFVERIKELIVYLSDDTFLAWGITIAKSIKVAYNAFMMFYRTVSVGLKTLTTGVIWFAKHLKSIYIYLKEGKKAYNEYMVGVSEFEENAARSISNQMRDNKRKAKQDWQDIKDAAHDISKAWELEGAGRLTQSLVDKYEPMTEFLREQAKQTAYQTENRKKLNQEMEKTFKLTKSMAEQFALSTRVEQEQTKYMISRIQNLVKEDIASLTELEKKIISSQGILKELFKNKFGEYAEEILGFGLEEKLLDEIDALSGRISRKKTETLQDIVESQRQDFMGPQSGERDEVETTVTVDIRLTGVAEKFFETADKAASTFKDKNVERLVG